MVALLVLAGPSPARADVPAYTIGPAPKWVIHLPVPDVPAPAGPSAGKTTSGLQDLLFDLQTSVDGGTVRRFSRTAQRLLNPQGLEEAAQVKITVQPAYERLTVHWVRIHRGRDRIDALRPGDLKVLQREQGLEDGLYRGTVTVHAVLHDVRVGDVIDCAYSIDGANPIFAGKVVASQLMGWSFPVARVYRRLLVPTGRAVHVRNHGFDGEPTLRQNGDQREYVWDRRDVAAIEPEDRVPDVVEDMPWVQLSEFATWNDVARWASKLFDLERPATPELAAQIEAWRARGTPEQQALAAFAFVRDEVRYFGVEIGRNAHEPQPPGVVFGRRWGDCKDKALLLVVALRALGIEARPALVSTNVDAGLDHWQPSAVAFNHAIVRAVIGGQGYWLDPTRTFARGDLAHLAPPRVTRALIVDPATDRLTVIAPEVPAEPTTTVEEKLTLRRYDGDAALVVTTTRRGADADGIRAQLADSGIEKLGRAFLNFYVSLWPKTQAQGTPTVQDDPVGNVVRITERYAIPGFWSGADNDVYAHLLEGWLAAPRIARRRMPLAVAHPVHQLHLIELDLPERYDIPREEVTEQDAAYELRRTAIASGSEVVVRFEYWSRGDQVPVAQVGAHLESLQRARKLLGYGLKRGDPDAGSTESKPEDFVIVGGGAVVGLVALIIGLRTRRVKRRRAAQLRAEGRGLMPANPLKVVPELARLGGLLPEVLCTCGGSLTVVQAVPIWHEGRTLVAGHARCTSCGRIELYYLDGGLAPGAMPPSGLPYASPPPFGQGAAPAWPWPPAAAPLPFGPEVWRHGEVLVMRKSAALPHRCIYCNRDAAVRLRRALWWHEPALYATVLAGLLIYAIIAAVVRKNAVVDVPLCQEHDRVRRRNRRLTIGLVIGGLASFVPVVFDERLWFLPVLGGLALLAAIVLGLTVLRLVVPSRIDDHFAWLRKVSPAYLATLPPAPPGLAR